MCLITSFMSRRVLKALNSVQALRGIAAILVLFFHIAEFQRQIIGAGLADRALVSGLWDQGWAGVDLFFVISGFIMVYVTQGAGRSAQDVGKFLWARITRIFPLWWVWAGFMVAYFWVAYGIPAAPDRVAGPGEAMGYAVRSLLLIPQESAPILGLGWSLIHEMFFYCVFALLLFCPRRIWVWLLLIWVGFTVLGASIFGAPAYARNYAELFASPLNLEFIAGALTGLAFIKGRHVMPKLILSLGLIAVIIGFMFFPQLSTGSITPSRVMIFTLPFAAIIYGWSVLEVQGKARIPRWLSQLGNWSYSLYLTHYIVLVGLRRLYAILLPRLPGNVKNAVQLGGPGAWDNILFAILAIIISVGVAALSYRLIERPLMRFFRRRKT